MTASNRVLGATEATMAIARVTWRRTVRGKALWLVVGLCLLPEVFALAALPAHEINEWYRVFAINTLLMALLPPILIAGMIGEELEERTMAYLWSRPLPRWSILVGKLAALVPTLCVIQCAALALPYFTALGGEGMDHPDALAYSMLAVVISTIASAVATTGLATLAPRFGIVLALGYLIVLDVFTLGGINGEISQLSIAWNTRELAGARGLIYGGGPTPQWDSLIWLVGITAAWMAVAMWRIRRIE